MKDKVNFRPISKFEKKCSMDIETFKREVEFDIISDDDGFGCYATETEISDYIVDFWNLHNIPSWATHVAWFNK